MNLEALKDLDEYRRIEKEVLYIGKSVLKSGFNEYFSNVMASFNKIK